MRREAEPSSGLCPICGRWCDTLPNICGRCAGKPPEKCGSPTGLARPPDIEQRIHYYRLRVEKRLPLFEEET